MPVATQATVKGVDVGRLRDTGARMVLGNAYHLHLRPGEDQVAVRGGLQAFMGWDGPMLTDSGGFQVFSLAKQVRVTEEASAFSVASRWIGNRVVSRTINADPRAARCRYRNATRSCRRIAKLTRKSR